MFRLFGNKNKTSRSLIGTKGTVVLPYSFESGEQGDVKAYFSEKVRITKIYSIVTKALAATDSGTLQGANNGGNSTGGLITHAASSAIGTETSVSPTSNNVVAAGSFYKVTPAKTTAGGKGLVILNYQQEI